MGAAQIAKLLAGGALAAEPPLEKMFAFLISQGGHAALFEGLVAEVFKQLPFVWNRDMGPCRALKDNWMNFNPNYCASTAVGVNTRWTWFCWRITTPIAR